MEHHASSDVFFFLFFYDYFGDCFLIWGCVAWLIVPSLLLAGLLMVELPCPVKLPLALPAQARLGLTAHVYVICNCCYDLFLPDKLHRWMFGLHSQMLFYKYEV